MYAKRNIKRRFNGTFPCPNLPAPEKFYFEKLVPYWSFGNLKMHCQDLGELCLLNEIQLGCREADYYCAPYEKDSLIPDLDFSHEHMLGDEKNHKFRKLRTLTHYKVEILAEQWMSYQ
jgi:hypothetical protein